jgi:hypothetical protein
LMQKTQALKWMSMDMSSATRPSAKKQWANQKQWGTQ